MDFIFSDEQQAISDLAAQILGDKVTQERLKAIDKGDDDRFARDIWEALAAANLLGIALPEDDGGSGFGILEACMILEQVGRAVAPVPYFATIVLGALPLAAFGTPAQRAAWLPGVISGETLLTAALCEEGAYVVPDIPSVSATATAEGWVLDGEKWFVPSANLASRILVPARTPQGATVVALVDPSSAGVTLERLLTTSGLPEFALALDNVHIATSDVLGDEANGADIVRWMTDRAIVGVCALQAGVCEAALKLTATYTSERKQFDTPIATFQAVAHRAADAYIDTQGVRFTMWQAAWRLAEDHPAADAIDVAKFWAADGGQRMIHGAQHLHGGIGVDTDYPLHRYFRWSKQLELTLGGATEHLRLLGARLAADPA
jgi:alkylation response protein AidB-like acyl-CoA dehydrogenase